MRTKEELKEIAKDIYNNKIFTDRHVNDKNDLKIVFPVLMLMSEEQWEDIRKGNIALIYEYLSNATTATINKQPIFMSCQTLNKKELKIMAKYHNKIKKAMESIR